MLSEIDAFINWVRMRSPQAKTWRDYSCDLTLFSSVVGDQTLADVLPQDVDRFVERQIERGFKPTTINRRLAAVVSFYRYLISKDRAQSCPVLPRRHYLHEPQRLPRPVSDKELRTFFGAIQDARDLAMFTLMLRCGLRIGEVSNLKMTDLYLGESPSRLIVHGKGSQERTVYLSTGAESILQNWLAQRPAPLRGGHIFLSYQNRRLSTTSISKRIQHICGTSGVRRTAHRLRHTFADQLLSAGMPITSIQKLMGHRFLETTQNYAMANDRQVQADFYQACEKLDGWKLLPESCGALNPGLQVNEGHGQEIEEPADQPKFKIPPRISNLPGELAAQLKAYRQLKASRWRVERVAANSTGFYSLHGRLWEFFSGECDVKTASELQSDHVLQFMKARLEAGCSARTVNGSLSCLRSFLNFLKDEGVPTHPSLDHLQRLKEPERLPRYLAYSQVLRLENEMGENIQKALTKEQQYDALLLRAAFYLLWQSGLRSGELELLRFSDFYLSQADQAKRLFIRDGKWRKGRTVYLTDVTLEALRDYLAVRGVEQAGDFVFVRNGRPLQKNYLSGRLKAVGRQVDIQVSAHRLRHTYATQLLNVGCRVTSIQKLLGHTNLNTTMIYARALDHTVIQDYFQALDTLELQDGAWFGLNDIPTAG